MVGLSNEYTAVLDTCVLAPMPLCDTLLRMAEYPGFYIPKWSRWTLVELHRTLRKMGYNEQQAERRKNAMVAAFEDATVDGYEPLESALGNDPKDRHVLAAAIRCGADAIVTHNLKHFGPEAVGPYELDVMSPDDFLIHQFHFNDELVRAKLDEQADALGVSQQQLLLKLSRSCPRFVEMLG